MRFYYPKPTNYKEKDIKMVKKALWITLLSFLAPFFGFLLLAGSPLSWMPYHNFIIHLFSVIVICSISVTMSYFVYKVYLKFKNIRLFITSCFFYILFISFFFHGILILQFYFIKEEIADIAEHMGVFFAAAFLLTFILPLGKVSDVIYRRRKIILFVLTLLFLGFIVSLLIFRSFMWSLFLHLDTFVFLTGVVLLADIILVIRRYLATWHGALLYLISILSVLINTAIIPLFYEEWNILWWYFHFVILIGLVVVLSGLFADPAKFRYYKPMK